MNKQYGKNTEIIRENQKTIQNPREDVKNIDTKQHNSYKHRTVSTGNAEELNQRKRNITAESKRQKIHKFVETPF